MVTHVGLQHGCHMGSGEAGPSHKAAITQPRSPVAVGRGGSGSGWPLEVVGFVMSVAVSGKKPNLFNDPRVSLCHLLQRSPNGISPCLAINSEFFTPLQGKHVCGWMWPLVQWSEPSESSPQVTQEKPGEGGWTSLQLPRRLPVRPCFLWVQVWDSFHCVLRWWIESLLNCHWV